ncbi:hypothetical protein D4S03_07115 [bacterium]|nr:MAG: hypothetical protein D4S03_07115 [bacterium]
MKKPLWEMYIITDIAVTITVIATVVSMIVSTFNDSRKTIETASATAEVLGIYRVPVSAYYALHGEWPKDIEELAKMFPERSQKPPMSLAENIQLADAAITFAFRGVAANQTLTIHPAVPAQDPFGPVKWVAGAKSLSDDWTMIGNDRTTVESKYMLRIIKQ